jgi:hypothetical protein
MAQYMSGEHTVLDQDVLLQVMMNIYIFMMDCEIHNEVYYRNSPRLN